MLKDKEGNYKFGYQEFRFCPICGALMPKAKKNLQAFFDVYDLHTSLLEAKRLLFKSEFEAAAREAFIVLENTIKKKAGLPNLHGKDLVAKSFSMDIDKQTGVITTPPLIALNQLKTESQWNEQEGIKLMLMGFFQGPRNLYQHNLIGTSVNMTISIFLEASFFLYLIEGDKSLLEYGRWIQTKIDYREIYENMPSRIDRFRLLLFMKHRQKKLERQRVNKSKLDYNKTTESQDSNPT